MQIPITGLNLQIPLDADKLAENEVEQKQLRERFEMNPVSQELKHYFLRKLELRAQLAMLQAITDRDYSIERQIQTEIDDCNRMLGL